MNDTDKNAPADPGDAQEQINAPEADTDADDYETVGSPSDATAGTEPTEETDPDLFPEPDEEGTIGEEATEHLRRLRSAVRRIYILIEHASEAGLELPDEARKLLLKFGEKFNRGLPWSVEDEDGFWKAASVISKELSPVTPKTLVSSGRASITVISFGAVTAVALVMLIYMQFVWVVLNNLANNVELRQKEYSDAELQIELLGNRMAQNNLEFEKMTQQSQSPEGPTEDVRVRVQQLTESMNNMEKSLFEAGQRKRVADREVKSSITILEYWLPMKGTLGSIRPEEPSLFDSDEEELRKLNALKEWELQKAAEREFWDQTLLTWAKQVLQGMSAYILPMFYGIVGACAYVMRGALRHVSMLTFSPALSIQYILRIVLGALAGISVGWFLKPEGDSVDIASSLSPLALAFVAGYSVELVFAAMDRVVGAFTDRSATTQSS
jgi:hypothetical protein